MDSPNLPILGKICTPAYVYLVLSTISWGITLFFALNPSIMGLPAESLGQSAMVIYYSLFVYLFIVLWTFVLNLICKNVSVLLVWVLAIFPIISAVLMILGAFVTLLNDFHNRRVEDIQKRQK
jgi:hypothetical protein